MRHLFFRGSYKPLGVSGETIIQSLCQLEPEIYGSINDPERVELNGLLYVFQRLPQGIEACRFVKLISREGLDIAGFQPIVPPKRRRNCYRIDEVTMFIEMTRGTSDIYDVLTHLTFMYIESEKIRHNALDSKMRQNRVWTQLEAYILARKNGEELDAAVGITYLSALLGRSYAEVAEAYKKFEVADQVNDLFEIVYQLGKHSMDEFFDKQDREINFSPILRQIVGQHSYGEQWAHRIKAKLESLGLLHADIHIISSNMHSVMNVLYAQQSLRKEFPNKDIWPIAEALSDSKNLALRDKVKSYSLKNGLTEIKDDSGANIDIHIIDLKQVDLALLGQSRPIEDSVLVVMDYAFGEQAFELMDELLKPYEKEGQKIPLNIKSVNIMGKAGILTGNKGDIMIPHAHVIEGSADNYPFDNALKVSDFDNDNIPTFGGSMITVMGTSLQNKDILRYFRDSSWGAIGLEMEGAHYQKAIQAASKIRKSVSPDLIIRYAYYASDNPLETGSTLASGALGLDGVRPTYVITLKILEGILRL